MAKTGEAKVKLSLINNVSPQLKKINNEVKSLSNNMNKSLAQATRNANNFTSALSKATRGFSTTNQQVNKISQSLARMNTQMNNMGKGNNSLEAQLKRANTQAQSLERTMKRISNLRTGNGQYGFTGGNTNIHNNSNLGVRNALLEAALTSSILKSSLPKGNLKKIKDFFSNAQYKVSLDAINSLSGKTAKSFFGEALGKIGNGFIGKYYTKMVHPLSFRLANNMENPEARQTLLTAPLLLDINRGMFTESLLSRLLGYRGYGTLLKGVGIAKAVAPIVTTIATTAFKAVTTALKASLSVLATAATAASMALYKVASLGVQMSDAKTNAVNKYSIISDNPSAAFEESIQRAIAVRANVEDYNTLASRLAVSSGLSTDKAFDLTDWFYGAGVIGGATTNELMSSAIQFSQGYGAGVLRGEEYNSIVEQNPYLANLFKEALGVDSAGLKAMADNGEITRDVIDMVMGKTINKVRTIMDDMLYTFGQLKNIVNDLMYDALQPLTSDFQELAQWLKPIFTEGVGYSNLKGSLNTGYGNLKKGFFSQIENPYGAVMELKKSFERLMGGSFTEMVGAIGGKTFETITHAFHILSTLDYTTIKEGIVEFGASVDNMMMNIDKNGGFQGLIDGVGNFMKVMSAIVDHISWHVGNLLEYLQPFIDPQGFMDKLKENPVKTVLNMFNPYNNFEGTNSGATEPTQGIMDTLFGNTNSGATESAQSATSGGGIVESVKSAMGDLKAKATEAAQSAKTAMDDVVAYATEAGNNTATNLETPVDGAVSNAYSSGADYAQNIAQGVLDNLAVVEGAGLAVANALAMYNECTVPDAGPLHRMMEWGKHYDQNIAKSITDNLGTVKDAAKNVAGSLAIYDDDGKLTDESISNLRSFNSNSSNRVINAPVTINMNNNWKGNNGDVQAIVKQIEIGLRQSLSTSLV